MITFDYDSMSVKFTNLTGYKHTDTAINQTRLLDKVTTKVDIGETRWKYELEDVRNWCEEHFENDWTYSWSSFYFKHGQDATMFALKWGGHRDVNES